MSKPDSEGEAMGCVWLTVLFAIILCASILYSSYEYLKKALPVFF